MINCCISNHDFSPQEEGQCSHNLDVITNLQDFHEYNTVVELHSTLLSTFPTYSITEWGSKVVESFPEKPLNINSSLILEQEKQLIQALQKFLDTFSWEYTDTRGIHLDTCIHHIYIEENARPVRQPQRRMNPTLREIMKDEL